MEHLLSEPLFLDRVDAGRELGRAVLERCGRDVVVVGLARGGVQVGAEVARVLEAPLDALAVRKIRHPFQPEYALGAATPDGGIYLRGTNGLPEGMLARAVTAARDEAIELDGRLHVRRGPVPLAERTVVLVDDGLATGATMVAAARWARAGEAARVVAAAPVAPPAGADQLRPEVDDVVVLATPEHFFAVATFYALFPQLGDDEVLALLDEAAARQPATLES